VLASFLPDGFEAYARIFHPARPLETHPGTTRWAALAERNGTALGPETGFHDVIGLEPDTPGWDELVPINGCLPQAQASALVDVLEAFTGTPRDCWFCIWIGHSFWGGRLSLTWEPRESELEREKRHRAAREKAEWENRELDRIPVVHTEHRDYYLFRGPMSAVPAFEFGAFYQSPNLWWPEDRAWCAATEVDGYSTYVGGSRECIQAICLAPDIEALKVTIETRMDPG
jgi:hypothetical protein